MYIHAVLPAVTRRRKRRTRNARGSATGSGGKTETGAEMRENVPAARRAKTRSGNGSGSENASGNENGNGNGSASLRAIKETSRFVSLSGVRRAVLHSRGGGEMVRRHYDIDNYELIHKFKKIVVFLIRP